MGTVRFDSSARRFTARLAHALNGQQIGKSALLDQLPALEHQDARRRSEKLTCDGQPGRSAAYYDKISVNRSVGAEGAKILYSQFFSPSMRRHYPNDCRLTQAR